MTGTELAMLLQIAMTLGPAAYNFVVGLSEKKIPTYAELLTMNDTTQAKIDAEMKRV